MFASCCCGAQAELLTSGPAIVEGYLIEDRQFVAVTTDERADQSSGAGNLSLSARARKSPQDEQRHRSSEDEAGEKARLQSLVDAFAKKAVRGCPSTHLDDRTGGRTETLYRIDKTLRHLTLLAKDDRRVMAECPIEEIQDIYLVEDGEECFPPGALERVHPNERELLLMLVYGSSSTKVFSFCMLEDSRQSRDMFLESMRVLSIYAAHAPPADKDHLTVPACASPPGRPAR